MSKIIDLKMKKLIALFFVIMPYILTKVQAQNQAAYMNPSLSTEYRVNSIIKQLTLAQKIELLQYRGTAIHNDSLEIPAYNWWNECLHGVARSGKATVFPQAIGLAATWDAPLIHSVADVISDEARAKFQENIKNDRRGIYEGLNFWSPNINIFRDPRWGRGMETYGEDPYLTGKIASAFIRGLQGDNPQYYKTIATVKHFVVHSGPEEIRSKFNAVVSDRDFYETYTPAFKTAIQDAGVYSLMCAYNRFRDIPCCGSDFLLNDLLRRRWGFKGFIVTDCGALNLFYKKDAHGVVPSPEEAAAMAIKAGTDLECGDVFNTLNKAIDKHLLSESDLDNSLRRLFTARFKLGLFDPPALTPFNALHYDIVENAAHQNLSLEAAKKAIVLLKNNNHVLPLNKSIKTLAVIGPNANDSEALLANYNGYPTHVITPLEGITKKLPGTKVLYARGCRLVDGFPAIDIVPSAVLFTHSDTKEKGLTGTYFANPDFKGDPIFIKKDTAINFNWINHVPDSRLKEDNLSVVWKGFLKAPKTGRFILDMYGSSQFELIFADKDLLKFESPHGAEHQYAGIDLVSDSVYKIEIRYASTGISPQLKFNWALPEVDLKGEALRIASQADAVVMCMGLSPRIEGEEMKLKLDGFSGGDRTSINLPKVQENLIKEVVALGKPVILVLINGSALAINWADKHVPGIIEAWYGGQQSGNAIAYVLFGDYNPGGKLPVTFYRSDKDLPAFENYDMADRTYRYFKGTALYPFGYGLSYSHFNYRNLRMTKMIDTHKALKLSVTVKNTSRYNGEEVVQVYLSHIGSSEVVPLRSLKGFQRVKLKSGEQKNIFFTLPPSSFSLVTENGKEQVEPGNYQITIGGGQLLKKTKTLVNDNVLQQNIRLIGNVNLIN